VEEKAVKALSHFCIRTVKLYYCTKW